MERQPFEQLLPRGDSIARDAVLVDHFDEADEHLVEGVATVDDLFVGSGFAGLPSELFQTAVTSRRLPAGTSIGLVG